MRFIQNERCARREFTVKKMGENIVENMNKGENRTHTLAWMRFFSVDAGSDMNLANTSTGIQVPELKSLCCREFLFKLVELVSICLISLV